MRVVEGRGPTPEADRAATARLLSWTAETGDPAFRAWTPHRQVAFGRRDATAAGYEAAREAARERGYTVVERSVGGRAVAYSGRTLAFAHAVPLADPRSGLDERYEAAVDGVLVALDRVGVAASRGEPPESFCPGAHSVQCRAGDDPGWRKVAGVAQRITDGAALVAGCLLVADHADLAAVLTDVYRALSEPFDPGTVGSVTLAGGPDDPGVVAAALVDAFAGTDPDRVDVAAYLDESVTDGDHNT